MLRTQTHHRADCFCSVAPADEQIHTVRQENVGSETPLLPEGNLRSPGAQRTHSKNAEILVLINICFLYFTYLEHYTLSPCPHSTHLIKLFGQVTDDVSILHTVKHLPCYDA